MSGRLLRILVLFPLLLALQAPALQAAEVSGLFEATVPVANQGGAERSRAVADGFRQVLVKASGQGAVLSNPVVAAELGKAESLLGSYRYESLPVRASSPNAAAANLLRIRLTYDAASVLALLNRAGAPVWGANRPMVYLWVAGETAPARTLHTAGTAQGDVLIDAAARRGLPVVLPPPGAAALADDIAAGVPRAVLDAAGQAGAGVTLAAVLSPAAGKWRARGVLQVEGAGVAVEAVAADEFNALRELVGAVADPLGGRYAVVARQDRIGTVRLSVSGVGTLDAHAGLLRWFRSQPQVKDLVLLGVDADRVDIELALAGDPAVLARAMQVDGRFASVGTPVADDAVTRIEAGLRAP